jgi:hypothetical protein
MARGKRSSGDAVLDGGEQGAGAGMQRGPKPEFFRAAATLGTSVGLLFMGSGGFGGNEALALTPVMATCVNGSGWAITNGGNSAAGTAQCGNAAGLGTSFSGVYVADDTTSPSAWISLSNGTVTLSGTNKIQMNQYLDMTGHSITNLAPGAINATSTDAINGGQLFSVSNSLSTVVSSASSSMSVSLSTMSSSMASLSTGWISASTSLSTGMS